MNATTVVAILLVVPWTLVVGLAVMAYRRQQRRRAADQRLAHRISEGA